MMNPFIEFRDVTKRFGERTVLDRVNLEVYEGEITTIIGKSGVGKSVLLKHVIGLLSPDEGSIMFKGKPIQQMKRTEWDTHRSQISYMFQNNALFDSMTVFDNVALPLRQTTNLKRNEIEYKVLERLEQTELLDASGKYPSELSGGMQKRVALARALVTDPTIVLFDEPTTGQDPIRRNAILSMIAQYRRRFGFTAIVISHDIPDIYFISDRIVLLWEGRTAFQGTQEELTKLDHPMIDEFLRSLEGVRDELTGLLSKQMFRARYDVAVNRDRTKNTVTAVLFSVELDLLTRSLGHLAAAEVVKSLGEYISTHLGAIGGLSSRQGRGQILTILPHVDVDEAHTLVSDFSRGLEDHELSSIQRKTQATIGADACFEISIYAGIVKARSNEDFKRIVEDAEAKSEIIARFQCPGG
jgi:phospholipid/cholesterol/gamma-HCH transport system ATP-binding protein